MNYKRRASIYILVSLLIIFCDQLTKRLSLVLLSEGIYNVTSWLSFNLVFNRGISWGVLSSSLPVVFWGIIGVIAIITFILLIIAYRGFLRKRFILGELLVIAGSISNLIDRFDHHAVVDFIEISYKGWSWPTFNIADCCIVCGVMLILITQYKNS